MNDIGIKNLRKKPIVVIMSYSEDATSDGHCCEPTLLQLEVVKLFEERVLVKNILRKQPIVVIMPGSGDATSHVHNNSVVKGCSAKFRSNSYC